MPNIIDYSNKIKKEVGNDIIILKENAKDVPPQNARVLMIGPAGSGKTSLLLNLLLNPETKMYFTKLYVYAKDLEEGAYRFLKKELDKKKEMIENSGIEVGDLYVFEDELEKVIPVDDLDKKQMNIVVFDDFVGDAGQGLIEEHFKRGRKKNTTYIYLTQSYFLTPKFIRLNCTHFVFFKINSRREMQMIASDHASDLTTDEFQELYKEAISEPHQFLYLDKNNQEKSKRYRKGFDGYADFDDELN